MKTKTKIYHIEMKQQDKGWEVWFEPTYGNRFVLCFATANSMIKFLTKKLTKSL